MKKQKFKLLAMIIAIALSLSGLGNMGTYYLNVYADEITNDNPEAIEISPGDVNFDDVIDAEDALDVLKHAARLQELGEYNLIRADVDVSGIADAQDALYILQYAADIISSFDEVRFDPPGPLDPTDEPTPKPTKEPTGHEIYDSINVEYDYSNSFVVELTSTENKTFTAEDFPEVALTDVWIRGKMKTEEEYLYELVMVLDAETCTEDILTDAMLKVKAMDGVSEVTYNEYAERDTILELNHSEYILEVGESIDLSIADYRPYDASTNDSCLIIDFNQETIDGEALGLEVLSKYGVEKLTEGSYIMTGSNCTWLENARSDYYIEVCEGWGNEISHLTVAHLLSQLPEIDMVQVVRTTFPSGNRYYEYWECSDYTVASMVLSGGDGASNESMDETKLNQTATISALSPGEVTVSVTKGGWGNAEGIGTCTIKVVEPDSVVYEATYPEMTLYAHPEVDREQYNEWSNDRSLLRKEYWAHYKGTLDGFFKNTVKNILGKETNENVILSPVNVYMSLAMTAETVDGNARKEILDLIGIESIEDLRKQANAVWNANYCDDGTIVSLLGNSLWLNDYGDYKNSTLKTLSDNYYASSFRGEMGSENYNGQLRNWLNENTGGMLREQINNIELNPSVLMAMYSTIYFRGKWDNPFWEGATKEDIFYGPEGEIKCDFMNADESWQDYYWADKFAAINKEITYGGKMWFILPDKGISPQEIINDEEYMKLIFSEEEWENKRDDILVNVKLPKFDIDSNVDLKKELKTLGADDIFSTDADFSPIIDDESEIFVSAMNHNARVTIDEEGCEATAFTEVIFAGAPMPPEDEVDFIANRPFIFVIESGLGTPLFVGIVNNP